MPCACLGFSSIGALLGVPEHIRGHNPNLRRVVLACVLRRAAEKRAMTFRCSALVAVLCACAAHGAETDYSKLKIVTLKRMLFVRGVECTHCTTKDEWASHMQLHSELPEREELAAEWVAQKEYAKKAKELSMTRDEFLKQMNETEGVRADRLWAVRAHATRTPRARHARAK